MLDDIKDDLKEMFSGPQGKKSLELMQMLNESKDMTYANGEQIVIPPNAGSKCIKSLLPRRETKTCATNSIENLVGPNKVQS